MLRSSITLLGLLLCISCGDSLALDADQGPCTGLTQPTCQDQPQCQEAYVASDFPSAAPHPYRCLAIAPLISDDTTCESLDEDHCRARSDCSPLFWEDVNDARTEDDPPQGAPEFKRCMPEP